MFDDHILCKEFFQLFLGVTPSLRSFILRMQIYPDIEVAV